jgi:hypothetical protein
MGFPAIGGVAEFQMLLRTGASAAADTIGGFIGV